MKKVTKVLEEGIKKILEKSRSKNREKVETIITEGKEYLVEFEIRGEYTDGGDNRFTLKKSTGEELSMAISNEEDVIRFIYRALEELMKEWEENREYQYRSCKAYNELYSIAHEMIDKQVNDYLGDTLKTKETRSYRLEIKYRTDKDGCVVLSSKSYRII